MAFEQILYDATGGVATITLNRPDKLNAVTSVLIRELIEAFEAADADDAVRAVIVTARVAPSAPAPISRRARAHSAGGVARRTTPSTATAAGS